MVGSRAVISLFVVCLLCGAVGAVASVSTVQGDSSEIRYAENTTGYLSPTNVTADGYTQTDLDVGSAITDDAQSLHARQDLLHFDERFTRASNRTQRREVVESTVQDINANVGELTQQQEQFFTAYGNGTIDDRTLVRELVTFAAAADRQQRRIEHVGQTVAEEADVPLPTDIQKRIRALRSEPLLRVGPVDERLRAAATGDTTATTYMQGNESVLVLATIADGTQYRQATVIDERSGNGTDMFGTSEGGWFDAATQRAEQLYPWAWANFEGGGGNILPELPFYFVDVSHPHGTLELYFDGTTENVFREHQRTTANAIPVNGTRSTETSALEVSIEPTYPTGPMRVTVTDAASAQPVEATLEINDQSLGTIDGEYWAIQPDGEFTVTATTANNETAVVAFP